jgi:hypothetical protein
MKKLVTVFVALIALACIVRAETLTAIDMADYGTTASITNAASVPATLSYARLTYDAATTNTLAVYVTKDGVDYRLGKSSVTNAQYVDIDLVDILYASGDVLKVTTTDTNVTVLVTEQ